MAKSSTDGITFFDFIPELATHIARTSPPELAKAIQQRGAGPLAYVIGGGERDGSELPLKDAIESAIASGWGVVFSCIPGRLALYFQEFPPGNAFILHSR